MTPEYINISNDSKLLQYDKVLAYFSDTANVLNVTIKNEDYLEVDFSIVKEFIENMTNKPNIYGLLTKSNNSDWKLRYVGQRKSKDITQRLRQHLIYRNKKTGSQLEKVKNELQANVQIGIKLTSVQQDKLRHYYEEKLLQDFQTLDWNIQK
ncbi:hypothetical protein [Flavobacterium filum]|uniref:hypothetical protein n=1 Tax=Flavobacterium filum TaxID=370974 RepID=UPI0023F3D2B1|nr:hypothetical protein [Flavobacterium filum]